ncbi:uncharacterized protein LOC107626995 [Arachis ipaensis]|uniref:uncharacterized protein LOC107626995 n=1 Tax=Arachis ipaensis TaxID=130454 RepID=UPI0007AFABAD|nr:uncharacterized protein LOC107626995 [Arachis ipaensis]XP_025635691.1 uncharacterized protein LOC112729754 [Arachis hypogaea]
MKKEQIRDNGNYLTERILRAKLSKDFDKPIDMKYDGTKDPQEHLMAFEARMKLERAVDAVRCRAFLVTLAGLAIKWFNALSNSLITKFDNISRKFMAQFTTRTTKAKHLISLLSVTQRPDEPTRKYLDRFNDKCLTNGLMNEDFRKHFTTKPVWMTMHEIQNIAKEYINNEEVSQVVAANKRNHDKMTPRSNPPTKETPKEHFKLAALNRLPRVEKFTNYTLLLALITEIYHQITEQGILPKARQLKERTGDNKSLYYDYHRGYGHKTQDCFDRKDALK